jgi:hypothetical protein
MMRHALLLTACLVPCFARAETFQSFDVPGAYGTCGSAIASTGLVAGTTLVPDTVGTAETDSTTPAQTVQPFLYAAGRLSYPQHGLPAGLVTFTGVNSHRAVTGNAFNGNALDPVTVNFVYHDRKISTPSIGALSLGALIGITDRGVILGETFVPTPIGGGFTWNRTVGFLRAADDTVTMIDDGSGLLAPRGMDAKADRVVGTGLANGSGGWLFSHGAFTAVTYPGSTFTIPSGVDESGTISGTYQVGDPAPGATVVSHGFFLRHGIYTTYDVPRRGVTGTAIQGMNEADQITGCYTDAKGTHGFIRTP